MTDSTGFVAVCSTLFRPHDVGQRLQKHTILICVCLLQSSWHCRVNTSMIACFHASRVFCCNATASVCPKTLFAQSVYASLALISTFLQLEEPAIKKLSTLCSRVKAAQLILVFSAFSDFDCEVQLLQGL